MTFTPHLRKLALTAHIVTSVGWLGSVAGWLALSIAGLSTWNPQMVRAAYLAMDITAWFVILPLAFASLFTGLVQSLGTTWGLVRHYWVFAKLLLTVFATIILLLKMAQISAIARAAAEATLSTSDLRQGRIELVGHAAGGVVVLLVITMLSVFKPWGMTPFGRRMQHEQMETDSGPSRASDVNPRPWRRVLATLVIVLIVAFLILHLISGGHGGH